MKIKVKELNFFFLQQKLTAAFPTKSECKYQKQVISLRWPHFYSCIFDILHTTFQTFLKLTTMSFMSSLKRILLSLLLSSKVSFWEPKHSECSLLVLTLVSFPPRPVKPASSRRTPCCPSFAFHKRLLSHHCPFSCSKWETENVEYNLQMPIILFVENNWQNDLQFYCNDLPSWS